MSAAGPMFPRHLGAFVFIFCALVATVDTLEEIALYGYDDLYQLALGLKVLDGAWPGLDFFTNYGPGVAVLAAPSWFFPSPVFAELALGYTLAALGLWALWAYARRPGRPACNLTLLLLLACISPLAAKYYFALWPGLLLLALGDPARERPPGRERLHWLALGIIVGLGGWFRLEIGLALGAGLVGVLAWRARARRHAPRRLVPLAALVFVGALVPWTLYFAAAALARGTIAGPADLLDFYLVSTFAKTTDFNSSAEVRAAFGAFNSTSLAIYLFILCAAASLAVLAIGWSPRAVAAERSPALRLAWCAAWFFLCLSPQALHRMDTIHFTQVLPCGLVALVLGLAAWRESAEHTRRPVLARLALVLLLIPALLGFMFHQKRARSPQRLPERIHLIARGLPALDENAPEMRFATLLRETAASEGADTLLVPSIDTRVQVLAGLPFAGILPHWSYRLPERWQKRHVEALRQQPASVLAIADFYRAPDASPEARKLDFLGRNPLIDAHVLGTYSRLVAEEDGWRILARSSSP